MIKDKTLVAALPTAKVLFLSHYSPIQKEKGAYKKHKLPQKSVLQIHNSRGIILATRALFGGFLHIKKQFIPHYKRIYTTNCRKTRTFANVNQTL